MHFNGRVGDPAPPLPRFACFFSHQPLLSVALPFNTHQHFGHFIIEGYEFVLQPDEFVEPRSLRRKRRVRVLFG